jgi:hypothetical protein
MTRAVAAVAVAAVAGAAPLLQGKYILFLFLFL